MLAAELICASMELDGGDANRLSIVPRRDLAAMRSRAATSIDLRHRRWFRFFKPSGSSEAKLWHARAAATARDDPPGPDAADATPETVGNGIRTNEHFVRFGSNFVLHPGWFVLGVGLLKPDPAFDRLRGRNRD